MIPDTAYRNYFLHFWGLNSSSKVCSEWKDLILLYSITEVVYLSFGTLCFMGVAQIFENYDCDIIPYTIQ